MPGPSQLSTQKPQQVWVDTGADSNTRHSALHSQQLLVLRTALAAVDLRAMPAPSQMELSGAADDGQFKSQSVYALGGVGPGSLATSSGLRPSMLFAAATICAQAQRRRRDGSNRVCD